MSQQEEHLILASNVSSFSTTNTHSSFKTRLARKRIVPADETWTVSLVDISYRQSWYNIFEDIPIVIYDEFGNKVTYSTNLNEKLILKKGFYEKISTIIDHINKAFENLIPDHNNIEDHIPKLVFDDLSQRVSIRPGKMISITKNEEIFERRFIPTFGEKLEKILGFVDSNGLTIYKQIKLANSAITADINQEVTSAWGEVKFKYENEISRNELQAFYPADIMDGFTNLYVYSNIVEFSDIGDAYSQILAVIPNKQSTFGSTVHFQPKNLVYIGLQTRMLDIIEIDIRDDRGLPVPFLLGNVVIKLIFTKHG